MRSIYATLTALIFGVAALPFTTNAQGAFVGNLGDDVPMDYDSGSNTFSFSDMEPIQTSGSLYAPGWGTIAWTPGTPPEQLFRLCRRNREVVRWESPKPRTSLFNVHSLPIQMAALFA